MFLPDRFVKGTCPKCKSPDQYGDNCEVCGATYSPTELIDPKSVSLSGATPVMRDSEHFFFDLPSFSEMLQAWTRSGALQEQVANKMQGVVRIRPAAVGHFPRCAVLRLRNSQRAGQIFLRLAGRADRLHGLLQEPVRQARRHHQLRRILEERLHGRAVSLYRQDIVYFHSLFWPAMLEGSNFRKPTNLFVHGYVTVNGAKMSKSRGTFIKASTLVKSFRCRQPALLLHRQALFAHR